MLCSRCAENSGARLVHDDECAALRLLRDAPEGKFSTNILWDRAIEEGRLFALPFNGEWFEVGTPAAHAEA